jgi:hypothetical protein
MPPLEEICHFPPDGARLGPYEILASIGNSLKESDMNAFFNALEARAPDEALRTAIAGYMDLVETGHREVFKIE